ncbi:hypothetical protein K439DRAFT_1661573 [Ramaria rubella]|nr:hypothetical protein K439DRAFT_1661573 [Ramaria rubella]
MFNVAFPPLPSELIYKICEFAGGENLQTARSIALVSKSLQRVIDPIIYAEYSIASYGDYRRFFSTLRNSRIVGRHPASTHVRTLYVEFVYAKIDEVVRACVQLERLAIYVWFSPMNLDLPLPAPREICILCDTIVVDLRSPLFRAVTHLNVGRATPSLDDLDAIFTFRHLTHLGFHCRDGVETATVDDAAELVERLLRWPQLKVLCVEVSKGNALPDNNKTSSVWSRLSTFRDNRLHVIPALLEGTLEERRQCFINGPTIWHRLRQDDIS